MKPRVLVVDDDTALAEMIGIVLRGEDFEPVFCADGDGALAAFRVAQPDLVLLDLMLPGKDGTQVCREIRAESDVPIIMLTAKSDTVDVVHGLESGADDYIVKPFSPGELMARLRAVLRRMDRGKTGAGQVIRLGNLTVDLDTYTVRVGEGEVPLTKKETELLYTLAGHAGKVFSRETLLETLWGYEYFGDSRTVDSHIKRLRAKLEAFHPRGWEIRTIWGVGYKLETVNDEK